MSELKMILDRAIKDKEFERTLRENPVEAMRQAQVESTPAKVAALHAAAHALAEAYKVFGETIIVHPMD
jgi:hypothetical protein